MTSGIYQIRNKVTSTVYVGSAVNVYSRWRAHTNCLKRGTHHCQHLQRSWDKHGADAFVFEIVEDLTHKEALILREQHYMDSMRTDGLELYNTYLTAGSPLGKKQSAEWVANMKARMRGNKYGVGIKPSNETIAKRVAKTVGRKNSAQHRAAISAARKGRKLSAEHCGKLSVAHMGKKMLPGTRAAIKAANTGRHLSDETRAKMAAAQLGKRRLHELRSESRARISAALCGRVCSPETRARISASTLAYHARQSGGQGQGVAPEARSVGA